MSPEPPAATLDPLVPVLSLAERPKRPDAVETAFQVALLSLRRGLRGKRFLASLAVVALPLLISLLVGSQAEPAEQEEFYYGVVSVLHFGVIVPFVALLHATSFPWPEAEEGTLTYWFTAPVWRWAVHLGRFAAAWLLGTLVLPLAVLAIGLPLDLPEAAEMGSVLRSTVTATLLAYPAYLAVFWCVSTLLRHGMALGLVFILVENSVAAVTGNVKRVTLVHYVRSVIWPAVPAGSRGRAKELLLLGEPAGVGVSIAVFASATVVALLLALVLVQVTEYRGRTSQPG